MLSLDATFLPRLPMTSLKDFAHGFHQSIISPSHSPNRTVARSLSGISAIVASGFFFRISPTRLLPSATIQHPHQRAYEFRSMPIHEFSQLHVFIEFHYYRLPFDAVLQITASLTPSIFVDDI